MAPTTKIPARGWKHELQTAAPNTWVQVRRLTEWGLKNSVSHADTTTADDEGWESHMAILRGAEITLSGLYAEDADDATRDPGQEAIEALAEEVGLESTKPYRITSPAGVVKTFSVSAMAGPTGGGDKDPTKWEATLKVDGKPTTTVPAP